MILPFLSESSFKAPFFYNLFTNILHREGLPYPFRLFDPVIPSNLIKIVAGGGVAIAGDLDLSYEPAGMSPTISML